MDVKRIGDACRIFCFVVTAAGVWMVRPGACKKQSVDIDLRYGIVKGYSPYISFLTAPQPSLTDGCGAQAVVKVDFSGPYDRVRFQLQYDRPRLWSLDISDSPFGDGYGGDNGTTSNMAETQIFNRQLRIYGNSLPGYLDASIDGGYLLKVVDNIVKKNRMIAIEVSDERVEWITKQQKQFIESKFLYTLQGQNTTYGEKDHNIYAGFNRVVAGPFRAGSGLCQVTITLFQDQIVDRCKVDERRCHVDATCYKTRKSFRCMCKPGFYGNGKICIDYDECEYDNGGCVHFCHNTHGNYSCSCMKGFQLALDGHNCIDVNECFDKKGGCHHQCINTLGSYECRCNSGYSLTSDGIRCQVGDWCQRQSHCAHFCQNTNTGGIQCACRDDYRLHANGRDCIPTCVVGNGGCQHICVDSPNGPDCQCHEKYMLREDHKTCIATCGVKNGGCDRKCEDTPQGPKCSCPPGYILHQDDRTCLDVDECMSVNGGCSHGCINTHGSFECICPKGYSVHQDEKKCVDIDECELKDSCSHTCYNAPGGYTCSCRQGYELYGETHCADTNECSSNNGGCEHVCENVDGGFECRCHPGYILHSNKKDCVAAKCQKILQVPAKTSMSCTTSGQRSTCRFSCHGNAKFTSGDEETHAISCGSETGFRWSHEVNNVSLPACSEDVTAPGYRRRVHFTFQVEHCRELRKQQEEVLGNHFQPLLVEQMKQEDKNSQYEFDFVHFRCQRNRKKRRSPKFKMAAEFEIKVTAYDTSDMCDLECARKQGYKKMKITTRNLRKLIDSEKLDFSFAGEEFQVSKKSLKAKRIENACPRGQLLVGGKCVSCSLGTYYDADEYKCVPCPPGTYQDEERQPECKACPHGKPWVGVEGAKNILECGRLCDPGTFSPSGLKPCHQCPQGSYQPGHGHTQCRSCGSGIQTLKDGASGFQDCQVKETCRLGHFYDKSEQQCVACPRNTYQPSLGQDSCLDCPGNTETDAAGATNSSHCKDRRCGGDVAEHQGFIQSPNWPGDYPSDVSCTWLVKPQKGRRILIIIPEIFLAAQDQCGDKLVMRKSKSPYSLLTYEACKSTETPIAFTARSRRLWIHFETDAKNSHKGFSIPYVTYNEEYQDLIDDIVRDGRLYSSYQHQEVLKDRKLLSALLEVIAHPYNYFKYANVSHSMFPASFIRLLKNKVLRFFEPYV